VLSSAQVAAMMQQQNQTFLGMQQYSHSISAQMPQPYSTIGNYGQASPVAQQFAQVPYAPRQHAGFSYGGGPSPFGYGLGNQVGAAYVSGVGGVAQFGLGAAGIASSLGLMGRAGLAFDPIGAGMTGFRLAGGGALGLGAGALAAGAVAAPMMFAQHAIGSMVTGAQEQAGVNQALGSMNFINPMSRTGRGFSRQDAMAIGSMVREMQSIPEMMTSMSELTRIMDRMGQSGMMQGVRDAGDFHKKFKETVHTLRDISKMMGSTMEEAMQAFQESKQAGFYSPQAIKQNIMQRQIVGGLTGMNQQQISAMQMQGSELSHQLGGSRVGGARSVTRIAGELGMANQMGLLSNEQIMEMTGQEGAAGIQALAGSFNEVGQRMGRSSLGTAMTLALGEVKNGRFTGNMDEDLVRRVRAGEIGKSELLKLAHQKVAGRTAKISFAAHRQRLTTEMVNQVGAQGISMELGSILGERGFDNPDALNLVMQRYGVGEEQANQVISMMKKMPEIQRGMVGANKAEVRRMAEQAFMRENASWEGIKHKIGKKFENTFTEPFKKFGAELSNSIGEAVEDFTDEFFGRYRTKVTDMASNTALKASMGDIRAKALVAAAQKDTSLGKGQDLRDHGFMQTSIGEVQADVLKGMGKDYYRTVLGNKSTERQILNSGSNILSKEGHLFSDNEYTVANGSDYQKAVESLRGENKLIGKIDVSKGPGKELLGELRNQLLSNEELQKSDITDQDKFKIIQERLNATGAWNGKDTGQLMGELQKQLGTDNSVNIVDALAKAGGLDKQVSMFSRKGLAGIFDNYGGAGSKRALAERIKKEEKAAAEGFGDKESLARTVLSEGGNTAKILAAAFGGGELQRKIQTALGEREGSDVDKDILKTLDITQKEFDSSRDQARELMSAGVKHGASGESIKKLLRSQLSMALVRNKEREGEIGRDLSGRISQTDVGGLSKEGQALVGRLSTLAGKLNKGEGFGDDNKDLLTSLADYKGKDRTKILGLVGEELGAGVQEIQDTRRAYSRSRKTKGGDRSVDALIEKLGLTGDVASDVRNIAKGGKSSDVDAAEEKKIEQYLGDRRTKSLSLSKGGEQEAVNASKGLQEYFDKQSKNMESMATLLQGLITTQKGTK
jgi:hypothetical protein